MKKRFLEELFYEKLSVEKAISDMEKIETFPDDGKSYDIHQAELVQKRHQRFVLESLIDHYIDCYK